MFVTHGLTTLLVTPPQSRLLPDVTAFVSLVYLPHGMRVVSTWLMGRLAILLLCLSAFLAEVIFTPVEIRSAAALTIRVSILVVASLALPAFEVVKLLGLNFNAVQTCRIQLKWLLIAGILASIINSVGQAIVFSGDILGGRSLAVLANYVLGDLIGLIVTILACILIFRWMRLFPKRDWPPGIESSGKPCRGRWRLVCLLSRSPGCDAGR